MATRKITIMRTELYERIWTTPMRTLAKEFGLSDVGLAKICRRHNVPRPGLGYWSCVQAGQQLKRKALPLSTDPRLDIIEIWHHESRCVENSKLDDQMPVPVIEVSADRQITHRTTRRLENSISRSRIDERGFLLARLNRIVPIKVTASTLLRALRITDVLFSIIEERGHSVEWPAPYNFPLTIVNDNEKLHFNVTEVIVRKRHRAAPEEFTHSERHDCWNSPRWDFCPTGRLTLTLESVEFPEVHRSWSDGKRQMLENSLGEVIVECQRAGLAIKQVRKARIDAERRRIQEQKLEFVAAERRLEYEGKSEIVKQLSRNWTESNRLRDFATALQAKALAPNLSDDMRRELEAMIDWIARHVLSLNPLSQLERTIQQFKHRA